MTDYDSDHSFEMIYDDEEWLELIGCSCRDNEQCYRCPIWKQMQIMQEEEEEEEEEYVSDNYFDEVLERTLSDVMNDLNRGARETFQGMASYEYYDYHGVVITYKNTIPCLTFEFEGAVLRVFTDYYYRDDDHDMNIDCDTCVGHALY